MTALARLFAASLFAAACAPSAMTNSTPTAVETTAREPSLCAGFSDALRACTPSACSHPHPFVRTFPIEHEVSGLDQGTCGYTQTMPGDMHMRCRFSEDGREDMAAMIDETMNSRSFSFSYSSDDPIEENTLTRECEVVDANGEVLPWGTTMR